MYLRFCQGCGVIVSLYVLLKHLWYTFGDDYKHHYSMDFSNDELRELRHQLKGPLTTINLYTEGLLAGMVGPLTEEQKNYIEELRRAGATMLKLVEQHLGTPRG